MMKRDHQFEHDMVHAYYEEQEKRKRYLFSILPDGIGAEKEETCNQGQIHGLSMTRSFGITFRDCVRAKLHDFATLASCKHT